MPETDDQLEHENTAPVPVFELNQPNDYSKYLLHSKSEILAVLRLLIQKGAMTTVHFNRGSQFFLTSVIAIKDDQMLLDVSGDNSLNTRVTQAEKLICTTFVDKVKIQFNINSLSIVTYEDREAFVGAFPDRLLRLQRRESFRLTIPVANPVSCNATIKKNEETVIEQELPLWDISGGGLGLMATPEQATAFQRGDTLRDCKVVLPEEGTLVASLRIRNMFEVTNRSGARLVRIGCEFVDIPPARLNVVQRYITRVERERKARLNGLV